MIPTQADFEFDLTARRRDALRATIQVVLDEELERLVEAGRYEHSDQRVDEPERGGSQAEEGTSGGLGGAAGRPSGV